MVVSTRLFAMALALAAPVSFAARADDPKPGAGPGPKAPAAPAARPVPADFALPGEDPPAAFVPRTPRTVAQQRGVEALRLYTEARALEDQGDLVRAIALMERALAIEPDSIPVLRRLALLCEGRGLKERSVEYSRRVLAAEPGDARAIGVVVDYYIKAKRDPAKAVTFLNEVLASPRLEKASPEAILVEATLARLYAATGQGGKAAETLARVIDAIDSKAGNRLTPADRRRILGDNEAIAYFGFGKVFLEARRLDLATRCFRRAAVYDDANPQLPILLAKIHLLQDQPAEALTQLDKALTRRVQDAETFQLLAVVLARLKREGELLPRLEAAAKVDPRNVVLRYILADLYRSAGMGAKADALLRTLLAQQPDLGDFDKLFATLLKEKKTEDLLRLLERAYEVTQRTELLDPKIDAVIADPSYTDAVLDAGLAMLAARPPRLDDKAGAVVLARIAIKAKKDAKHLELLRRIARVRPSPMTSLDLIVALAKLRRFDEAAAEAEALLEKVPDERVNPGTIALYANILIEAGRVDRAIVVLRELLNKGLPEQVQILLSLANALSLNGKADEAVTLFREALRKSPADKDLIQAFSIFLRQVGRTSDLIAFLKSVLDHTPNNTPVADVAHSLLSLAYTDIGDLPKAEAELEVLLAAKPEDAGVNNDLGYLYADQGKNLEKAEAMIRKALDDKPDEAAYLDSLGWVLFKRGKLKDAVAPLEKAIDLNEAGGRDDATVPEHLGDVYLALKDRTKARSAWEKAESIAARVKPADRRLPEIRKKLAALTLLDNGPRPATGANP